MTVQEAYDRIREHYSQPGAKFSGEQAHIHGEEKPTYVARYRTVDGRCCPIGLLAGTRYRPEWDAAHEGAGESQVAVIRELWPDESIDLAAFLSIVSAYHDDAAKQRRTMSWFLRRVAEAAADCGART